MSTNQLNVLVSLMIAIMFLVSESRNQSSMSAPKRYCGRELSDALHVLCNGVYNTMHDNGLDNSPDNSLDNSPDNSLDNSPDNSQDLDQEMEMPDYRFADGSPTCLPRARAREILNRLAKRRRISRGVHEECCANECTLSDLSLYCG